MGYNSNLSTKRNREVSKNHSTSNNAHPLWIIGTLLKIVGAIIIVLTIVVIVASGGWAFIMITSPLGLIPLVGILFLAFGQYFISNW